MEKITSILTDGQWHHFSNITHIYYATLAYRKGYLDRKEEKIISYRADGTKEILIWYVFRIKMQAENSKNLLTIKIINDIIYM